MKRTMKKIAVAFLAIVCGLSVSACNYRKDGSVIQDVVMQFSYKNSSGEDVVIDSTFSLYKTFAPKTCEHILSLIKKGYYDDKTVVLDSTKAWLDIGTFLLDGSDYKPVLNQGDTVEGEFKDNGIGANQLSVAEGSLVMLRDPDISKGGSKYNTAKASFALLYTSTININADKYCVFGKIDSDSLSKIKTMAEDLAKDSEDDTHYLFMGDRDETTGKFVEENGVYRNYMHYFVDSSSNKKILNKDGLKEPMEIEGEDKEIWNMITEATAFDKYVIPRNAISVKKVKIK